MYIHHRADLYPRPDYPTSGPTYTDDYRWGGLELGWLCNCGLVLHKWRNLAHKTGTRPQCIKYELGAFYRSSVNPSAIKQPDNTSIFNHRGHCAKHTGPCSLINDQVTVCALLLKASVIKRCLCEFWSNVPWLVCLNWVPVGREKAVSFSHKSWFSCSCSVWQTPATWCAFFQS